MSPVGDLGGGVCVCVWTVTLTKPLKKGDSEEAHYVFYIVQ